MDQPPPTPPQTPPPHQMPPQQPYPYQPRPPTSGWRIVGLIFLWGFAIIGFGATMCLATVVLGNF